MADVPLITILAIYADARGESHFRTVDFDMHPFVAGGTISAPLRARNMWFRIAPEDQDADFHVAPRRQLVITLLGGTAEFETSDGDKRQVKPGEILLVEDTFGIGHRTRTVDDMKRHGIMISLDEEEPS